MRCFHSCFANRPCKVSNLIRRPLFSHLLIYKKYGFESRLRDTKYVKTLPLLAYRPGMSSVIDINSISNSLPKQYLLQKGEIV